MSKHDAYAYASRAHAVVYVGYATTSFYVIYEILCRLPTKETLVSIPYRTWS